MDTRTITMLLALLLAGWFLFGGWFASGPLEKDRTFIVSTGDSLGAVAERLEQEGMIGSARSFSLRARLFGGGAPIKAGEFLFPKGVSNPARRALESIGVSTLAQPLRISGAGFGMVAVVAHRLAEAAACQQLAEFGIKIDHRVHGRSSGIKT